MQVRLTRIDQSLPLPVYQTAGAVAFDFLAREEVTIQPQEIALIPSNLIIETPPGYTLLVASRSSTPRKQGLTMPHGVGIIDQDYCGAEDEIRLQVMNFTTEPVTVARGERLAQGLFVRTERAEFLEVADLGQETRGGFGSTGH